MLEHTIECILVAVADPSVSSNKALRRAALLAHKTGARIELLTALPSSLSTGIAHAESERYTRLEADETARLLERIANRLRREEIIVNTHVDTGYPAHEAILRRVRSTRPDLLIVEARKHHLLARLLLTQTDFELIRHCPVPLLIVKRGTQWRHPRILAALDPLHANDKGREMDDAIAAAANRLAAAADGSVHAAHVFHPAMTFVPGMDATPTVVAAIAAQNKANRGVARKAFTEALGRYGIPKGRGHLVGGEPSRELARIANSVRAGVVVMGAMSRSGLKRMFIGNTAELVLDSLSCDVLVVKPVKR